MLHAKLLMAYVRLDLSSDPGLLKWPRCQNQLYQQLEILQIELKALDIDVEHAFREIQKLTLDVHNLERLRKSIRIMIENLEGI